MTPLAFFSPGPYELIVIGIVAVLLFGRRLPEVGRSLGKGIVEFKRGIRNIEDEIEDAGARPEPTKVERPSNLPNAGLPQPEVTEVEDESTEPLPDEDVHADEKSSS